MRPARYRRAAEDTNQEFRVCQEALSILADMPQQMDVPLLRAFVAIYETGSVTASAERLFVTQPSVSYALAKLREIMDDPLFVRSGGTMTPTPRARDSYTLFSNALIQIENALEHSKQFHPAESTRRYRVAMSDIGELIFLPPIFSLLQARAPRMELEVVQVAQDDVPGWLATGKIDVAVGNLPTIRDQTNHVHVFDERYVCLMREGHPSGSDGMSLERFASQRHAHVASQIFGHREVEAALRDAGVARSVALQVPHFTVLPLLISTTDLVAVVPSRVAKIFQSFAPLQFVELPFTVPKIEVHVHWDRRHDLTQTQQWFIELIQEALQSI